MKRLSALIACVSVAAVFAAQSRGPADLANLPIAPGAIRITYGADPLQFGELRLPPGKGPHPVAVVIHGGCWVSQLGKLDSRAVAIDNMRPMAAALTEAGVATWNVEYRRVGNEGGGWPGTFTDVGLAADALRTIAKSHPLDLKRVVAIGHSAGGHLALWLAARARIPPASEIYARNPLPLAGAINLDGPGDLRAMAGAQASICGRPVIDELMGGSADAQPARYRAASPAELLPLGAPAVSLTGKAFGGQNAAYEAAALKSGAPIEATLIPTATHFVFIDPQSDVWPQVLAAVRRLLQITGTTGHDRYDRR
jgi:acetyl esterase/lipase